MIIFTGCLEQMMTWCSLILVCDVDLGDLGYLKVSYNIGLCSFRFIDGQCSLEV
jgi:hypothetical protein